MATVESIERVRREREGRALQREEERGRQAAQAEAVSLENNSAAIDNGLNYIHLHAHTAHQAQLDQQEADEKLATLYDENRRFINAGATTLVLHTVCLASLPAVYTIDYTLFGPTARHIASKAYPSQPHMVETFTYLIPLVTLVLEVALAIRLADAREAQGRQREEAPWASWAGAIIAALVMPALITATQILSQPQRQSDRQFWAMVSNTIGMVGLALVAHGFLLFGGRLLRDALAFPIFKAQELWLRGWSRRHGNHAEREARAAVEAFNAYRRDLDAHNARYPNNPIAAGPFDRVACDVINGRHPYPIIETAPDQRDDHGRRADGNGGGNNPPPRGGNDATGFGSPPPPSPAPPGPADEPDSAAVDGENEYLRRVLNRQVRDAEDEVRP